MRKMKRISAILLAVILACLSFMAGHALADFAPQN